MMGAVWKFARLLGNWYKIGVNMTVVYVDENGASGFINQPADNICDYRDILQSHAERYFQDNPTYEFYCISVTNFDEKKSCVYEFQRRVEYSVTIY